LAADALCLVCPTDHWIESPDPFRSAIRTAAEALPPSTLCLFGVKADASFGAPSAYGHILTSHRAVADMMPVEQFVEKPSAAILAGWQAAGIASYINSGMVLGRAGAMLAPLEVAFGDITHTLREPDEAYPSFDVAVLEQTGSLAVVSLSAGWRDLGTWPELLSYIRRDHSGNATSGPVALHEAENCIVFQRLPEMLEITGVKDLVIIADDNALMVADVPPGAAAQGGMVWQRYPFTLWSLGDECAR